jgi:Subtilase family
MQRWERVRTRRWDWLMGSVALVPLWGASCAGVADCRAQVCLSARVTQGSLRGARFQEAGERCRLQTFVRRSSPLCKSLNADAYCSVSACLVSRNSKGVRIINNSYGCSSAGNPACYNAAFLRAIKAFHAQGGLFVVAAGEGFGGENGVSDDKVRTMKCASGSWGAS